MSMRRPSGSESLARLFPESKEGAKNRRSPRRSKATNQPAANSRVMAALDALPNVSKVPPLGVWEEALGEGLDWTDETPRGSPQLGPRDTHPRGSSTQEKEREMRDQTEVPRGSQPQDHADSRKNNDEGRGEGLSSALPLYRIEDTDTGIGIEEAMSEPRDLLGGETSEGQGGSALYPRDQSPSPSPPSLGSRGADTHPQQKVPTPDMYSIKERSASRCVNFSFVAILRNSSWCLLLLLGVKSVVRRCLDIFFV
jgi:hypothetical protein